MIVADATIAEIHHAMNDPSGSLHSAVITNVVAPERPDDVDSGRRIKPPGGFVAQAELSGFSGDGTDDGEALPAAGELRRRE